MAGDSSSQQTPLSRHVGGGALLPLHITLTQTQYSDNGILHKNLFPTVRAPNEE